MLHFGAVAGLLTLYWILAFTATLDNSFTFDEVVHLVAGANCWRYDDYRLAPENGILTERWAGLGTLGDGNDFPSRDQADWWESNAWRVGDRFFFQMNNDTEGMLRKAHALMAVLGVACGLTIYLVSRHLFGPTGGLLSLVLFVFCPNFLGHGALVTSDVPVSFFFLASLWSAWSLWHHLSPLRALGNTVLLAGLLLTKYSALLIVPMIGMLLILRLVAGRPLEVGPSRTISRRSVITGWLLGVLLGQVLVVWGLIWLAYGCRYAAFAESEPGRDLLRPGWQVLGQDSGLLESAVALAREYHLLPEGYLFGLVHTLRKSESRPAFLNGEYSTDGWFRFFPYAFLVKTPLALFLILGLALAAGIAIYRRKRSDRVGFWSCVQSLGYQTAPLWILLLIYWWVALGSSLNIGHRHLLPTYPPLFVLAGAAAYWLVGKNSAATEGEKPSGGAFQPLAGSAVLLTLVWAVVDSWNIRPHYLAYFNPIAGGPSQGYHHLVDSSLDWGQDLPRLKTWLDQHSLSDGRTPIYLAYFGSARSEHYGIKAIHLPEYFDRRAVIEPRPLQPGVYCISATMLQGVYLPNPGPWNAILEKGYQQGYVGTEQRLAMGDESLTQRELRLYDRHRFGRLCGWLTRRRLGAERSLDGHVGYSILIFRLSAEDLEEALSGPAP